MEVVGVVEIVVRREETKDSDSGFTKLEHHNYSRTSALLELLRDWMHSICLCMGSSSKSDNSCPLSTST